MKATTGGQERLATTSPPAVQVFALGGFRVIVRGRVVDDQAWRRKTARQLFKVLLSQPNRRMTRDEVIELLWPESDPDAASSNLRSTLHALRHALGPSTESEFPRIVFSDRDSVWLRPDVELWVDADSFEQTVLQAWRSSDPLPLLEEASALYAGHYLTDDLYADWAVERRDALKQSWAELQLRLSHELERRGDLDAAARPLHRLLQVDPCDERAAQELMRILIHQGSRPEALRVCQELTRSLQEQLGVQPSTQTLELRRLATSGEAHGFALQGPVFRCAYRFPEPSELIDRQVELGKASRALERGRASGQVVLISGSVGTGKSVVVGHLLRAAQDSGALCMAGGSYDRRAAVPLAPFQEALTDYVVAVSSNARDAGLSAAASELVDVVVDLRQHLGVSPATPSDEAAIDRMRLFGAVLTFVRRAAERQRVLICVEDLHAADMATLELLHYLARQTRQSPVVLLATFRSEEVRPGEPLSQFVTALARERLAEHIHLDPFGQDDTGRLIATVLDGPVGVGLKASVHAATEGNPLFVEQLVLSLREERQLERPRGLWERAGSGGTSLSPIVKDVIDQRLARLSVSSRATIETAAVLGPAFAHATLMNVLQSADESAALLDLDEAIRAQVLRETPYGYAFSHALLHDGVYRGISGPRRMLLHRRAGETLEQLADSSSDEPAAELAHHFLLAGPSALNREKALGYSLRAGRAAAALGSHRDALLQFKTAFGLIERSGTADVDRRLEALEGRGLAERNLGLWKDCIATLHIVLTHSTDALQRARTYDATGRALTQVGEIAAALEALDAGLVEVGAVPGPRADATRLQIRFNQAFCYLLKGAYRQVLHLGEEMLEAAAQLHEPNLLYRAHTVIALAQTHLGQFALAVGHDRAAIEAAELSGDKLLVAVGRENLGAHHYLSGDLEAARADLTQAIDLYHASISDLRAVLALRTLSRVYIALGDLVQASTTIAGARELALEGHDRWAAECNSTLAAIHSLRGEWDDGEACYTQALREHERVGHAAGVADALIGLGELHERRLDWPRAGECYRRAIDATNAIDQGPLRVAALRHIGVHMLRHADKTVGGAYIRDALAMAESMSDSLEYAPTLLAMAEMVGPRDMPAAMDYAQQAIRVGRTAELEAQTHIFMASAHAAAGRPEAASDHAQHALRIAERLASPWLVDQATGVLADPARVIRRAV